MRTDDVTLISTDERRRFFRRSEIVTVHVILPTYLTDEEYKKLYYPEYRVVELVWDDADGQESYIILEDV